MTAHFQYPIPNPQSPIPSAPASPHPRGARYHSLDLWRGVACLLVVVFHSTVYQGEMSAAKGSQAGVAALLIGTTRYMSIGVPMFFVISGYCISATADSTRRRGKRVSEYFCRRVRRIFPPYWIMLALFILFVTAMEGLIAPGLMSSPKSPITWPWSLSPSQWFGNVGLIESWRSNIAGGPQRYLLGPAWTLCYEEQFYAVMGLLLLVARRRLFLGAFLVTLLVTPVRFVAQHLGLSVDGFFFDGYWILFAAGILAYYRLNYARSVTARLIDLTIVAATAALLAAWPLRHRAGGNAYAYLLTGSLFTLVMIVLRDWDSRMFRSKWLRPLAWCGTMCYSLYLVHSPLVRCVSRAAYRLGITSDLATIAITVPLCAAVSIAVAAAFHLLVERRFLNPDSTGQPPRRVPVASHSGEFQSVSQEP